MALTPEMQTILNSQADTLNGINRLVDVMNERTSTSTGRASGSTGSGSGSREGNYDDDRRIRSEMETGRKRFVKELEQHSKDIGFSARQAGSAFAAASDNISKGSDGIESAFNAVTSAGTAVVTTAKSMGGALLQSSMEGQQLVKTFKSDTQAGMNMRTSLARATIGLGVMTAAVTFLVKQLSGSYTAFKQMSDAGVTFGSELVSLRDTSALSGLSLKDFTGYVTKNVSALSQLGGSATAGAKELAAVGANLRSSGLESTLLGMGITGSEGLEIAQEYMRIQQHTGSIQKLTTGQITTGTVKYAKSLKLLGELTGDSVDAEQKKREALKTDAAFQASMRGKTADQIANANATISAMQAKYGDAGAQYAKEMIANGRVVTEGSAVFASTMGSATIDMNSFAGNMGMGSEQFVQSIPGILKASEKQFNTELTNLTDLMKATQISSEGSFMGMLGKTGATMMKFSDKLKQMTTEDLVNYAKTLGEGDAAAKTAVRTQIGINNMMQTFRNIGASVFKAFFNETTIAVLTRIAETMASMPFTTLALGVGIVAIAFKKITGGFGAFTLALNSATAAAKANASANALGGRGGRAGLGKQLGGQTLINGSTPSRMSQIGTGAKNLGGKLLNGARSGGGVAIGGMLASSAIDAGADYLGLEEGSGADMAANALSGAASGAATGALIGSIIPGVGTAIGAGLGGAIGGFASLVDDLTKSTDKDTTEIQEVQKEIELTKTEPQSDMKEVIALLERQTAMQSEANDIASKQVKHTVEQTDVLQRNTG